MNENNKSIKELNEIVKSKLKGIARKIQDDLPNGYGFALLTFNFGENENNEMMYVSNANREDIVKSMQEFIEKTKDTYGNDTGKY